MYSVSFLTFRVRLFVIVVLLYFVYQMLHMVRAVHRDLAARLATLLVQLCRKVLTRLVEWEYQCVFSELLSFESFPLKVCKLLRGQLLLFGL